MNYGKILKSSLAAGLGWAALAAAPAAARTGAPEELSRSCPLVNVGTPSRPRLVKDPGCSSGR